MNEGPLDMMMARMPPAQHDECLAEVAHYVREFTAVAKDADSPSIAYSIHEHVDKGIANMMQHDPNAKNITCKRGCSHCCRIHVSIDQHEAELLATLVRDGVEINRGQLNRQRERDSPSEWQRLSPADRRCVFLSAEGECRVYEHRPNACRKYHVVTEPRFCNTIKFPGHQVGMLASYGAEVAFAAAGVAFKNGAMADMLSEALERHER